MNEGDTLLRGPNRNPGWPPDPRLLSGPASSGDRCQRRRFDKARRVRPGSRWSLFVRWFVIGILAGPSLFSPPASLLAQAAVHSSAANTTPARSNLPDAPQVAAPAPGTLSTMSGTVMDSIGEVVPSASVTLEDLFSGEKRSTVSNGGGYFSFAAVLPGAYKIAITAQGFASWAETDIPMQRGADLDLPHIMLKIASATTDVLVVFSQHELATEQVHLQEKQRVLGVVPNFYTSYIWNAAPLTTGQKFQLAWRSLIDPESFVASAGIAGVEQAQNDFRGYGQGSKGYAKRFGASYTDGVIGTMIGAAALPALLHQDPRYFYKGTGTIRQRALYAIATTVICKGDNGHWQPNYSNVGGNLAAGALSNLYYPSDERNGVLTTFDNALIGTAAGAAGALIQEFLLRHITPAAKPRTASHDANPATSPEPPATHPLP